MNRLLFAAARGARVQRRFFREAHFQNTIVVRVDNLDKAESDYDYRIHPEDEHLQYGPISSALRKSAIEGTLYAHANIPYIMGEYDFGSEEAAMMLAAQTQRGVFKLILAEALADEGL